MSKSEDWKKRDKFAKFRAIQKFCFRCTSARHKKAVYTNFKQIGPGVMELWRDNGMVKFLSPKIEKAQSFREISRKSKILFSLHIYTL